MTRWQRRHAYLPHYVAVVAATMILTQILAIIHHA